MQYAVSFPPSEPLPLSIKYLSTSFFLYVFLPFSSPTPLIRIVCRNTWVKVFCCCFFFLLWENLPLAIPLRNILAVPLTITACAPQEQIGPMSFFPSMMKY